MLKNKGFTLFTALVGFVIIGIGVLVMQHMTNSEQNYQNLLSALLTQQEMDSSINIIKLDALVSFDIIYRTKFFDYYNTNQQVGLYVPDADSWEDYKDNYIKDVFGVDPNLDMNQQENKAAGFVSNKLINILSEYKGDYKGKTYYFRVYDYSIQEQKKQDLLGDTSLSLSAGPLGRSINESLKSNEFISLLDCDSGNCSRGSFYTNFDFLNIPYSNYLYLPRILIIKTLDNTMIDDSILPYSKFSIYLPMRVFGGLNLAYNTLTSFSDDKLKNLEYGHLGNINCESITDFSSLEAISINITTFEDELDNLNLSSYTNKIVNDFNIEISKIESNRKYISEIYFFDVAGQSLTTLVKYKVSSVNITFDIWDNNLFENVGRIPMFYKFYGSKKVNDVLNPTANYCFCTPRSGTSGGTIECSPQKSNNSEINTKLNEILGGLGLTADEKNSLEQNIKDKILTN